VSKHYKIVFAKPGDFFPGDISVFEVAQHVHLTEDIVLVEQQVGVLVAALLVVVVLVVALSQLTSTRRQQTPRLITTSTITRTCAAPMTDTICIRL